MAAIALSALVVITAAGFAVGHAVARRKIADMVHQLAAARGFSIDWADLHLGLDGEIALIGARFSSTRSGRVEGEIARLWTTVTFDDVWNRRRPAEFSVVGLRLRADADGARGLMDADEPAGGGGSSQSPLSFDIEDFDLLFERDPDRTVACHIDRLEAQRADRVELRGRMNCRVPSHGLATGAFEATAIYDPELGDEPLQLVVESFGDLSAPAVGASFARLTASIGHLGGRIEISDVALAPSELDGSWPVSPTGLAVDSLVLNLSRSDASWTIDHLSAGPGEVSLTTGQQHDAQAPREPAPDGRDAEADEAEEVGEEDDEVLALEEASRAATSTGPPNVDWSAVEQDLDRITRMLDDALSRTTSIATHIEVREISFAIGGLSDHAIRFVLRDLEILPESASAVVVFAEHELALAVERLPEVAEPSDTDDDDGGDDDDESSSEGDTAGRSGLSLTLAAQDVDLERVSEAIGRPGLFTGHLDLDLTTRTRPHLSAELDVSLPDLVVNHPGISPLPVAPLPMAIETNLRFTPNQHRRLSFDVHGSLGEELRGEASATITMRREYPQLDVEFSIDEVDCRDMLAAIPEGLFVHFERDRMRVDGRAGVDGSLRYRFGDHRSFRIEFGESFPGTCEITRLPRAIRPDMLLSDTYRHRIPDIYLTEETIEEGEEIWVGPGTEGYVPLNELPPYVPPIMYFTEQRNFYEDPAISISLISKAVRVNLIYGRWAYGGSTITQQLVKNLFFDRGKTLARKLQEAIVSWAVFTTVPRDRILELYINCIEFGPDIWGIEAAAQYYFGISARELEPVQAVYLAGLKPSPLSGGSHRRRGHSPHRTRWRHRIRDRLQELADAGYIDQAYVDAQHPYIVEFADPVEPVEPEPPRIEPFD